MTPRQEELRELFGKAVRALNDGDFDRVMSVLDHDFTLSGRLSRFSGDDIFEFEKAMCDVAGAQSLEDAVDILMDSTIEQAECELLLLRAIASLRRREPRAFARDMIEALEKAAFSFSNEASECDESETLFAACLNSQVDEFSRLRISIVIGKSFLRHRDWKSAISLLSSLDASAYPNLTFTIENLLRIAYENIGSKS